ncbi:hypothetical protein [Virgisporangium aurantiacum]|uniref:Uncharacterized protein n=1 Tax=Virgisporangium aurantiacum TaxID=175570 RepID=A0A8J3ZDN0_9ACTN|nr:hypothetical protein [Virgisporangium aurantiacum]GIJ59303.1 hypothetical protein Vau01_068190 [Virgisporangium aurantiacum]
MPTVPEQSTEDEQRDLVDAIRRELIATAPAGWKRFDIKACFVIGVSDLSAMVLNREHTTVAWAMPFPFLVQKHLSRLRQLMYVPGRGTWFSARLLLDGRDLSIIYNDEHDPNWKPGIAPGEWVRDLEWYPRDPEHVPDWLRGYLRDAGAPVPPVPPVRRTPPPEPLDTHEQQRLLDALVDRFVHELPTHFESAHVSVVAYGDYLVTAGTMMSAIAPGSITSVAVPPDIDDRFRQLRAAMYRPGEGAWLYLDVYVTFPDVYSTEYKWSWDELRRPPELADCAKELERFPRDPEHIPPWIRAALATDRTPPA